MRHTRPQNRMIPSLRWNGDAMAGDIKLPIVGPTKPVVVYVLGAGFAGVLIVAYVRHKKNATAAPTEASAEGVDPATGYAYGSPEDAQALASQSAYQNPTDYGGGGGPPGNTPSGQEGFSNNAQWEQAAIAFLTGTVGLPADKVSAALGKYLNGQTIVAGSADDSYIQQAIAAEGQAPVAGANGFPPSIKHSAASPSKTKLTAPRIRIASHKKGIARIAWTAIPHALEYHVHYSPDGSGAHSTVLLVTRSLTADVHKNGFYDAYAVPTPSDTHYAQSNRSNVLHVTGI